jgi:hypothetical protein
VSFEHAAVFELERVVTLGVGNRVQLFDLRREHVRSKQLLQYELDCGTVILTCEHMIREAPHLRELCIELGDRALGIDDQDPVRGGVQRRGQQRQGRTHVVARALILFRLRSEQPHDERHPQNAQGCEPMHVRGRHVRRHDAGPDRDLAQCNSDNRPTQRDPPHPRAGTVQGSGDDEHISDRQGRSPPDGVDDHRHRQDLRRDRTVQSTLGRVRSHAFACELSYEAREEQERQEQPQWQITDEPEV